MKNMSLGKFILCLLCAALVLAIFLAILTSNDEVKQKVEQKKWTIESVASALEPVENGDMIVARGKERRVSFVVTERRSASHFVGYVPVYGNAAYQMLIGDFLRIVGDDGYIGIVPKEKVSATLNSMFSRGVVAGDLKTSK